MTAGLVYRKESAVNWDPVDMTVLANEQVIDGRGWRSGALVEKRKLSQWFLKITEFADDLLDGLGTLEQLAREGAADAGELDRQERRPAVLASSSTPPVGDIDRLEVFSTRPDTIFGASFAAIARRSSDRAGTGRERRLRAAQVRRGVHAAPAPPPPSSRPPRRRASTPACRSIHPLDPAWKLPLFVANFVLMDYGTGAVMGVPGA